MGRREPYCGCVAEREGGEGGNAGLGEACELAALLYAEEEGE